jgi:hypothetical protein
MAPGQVVAEVLGCVPDPATDDAVVVDVALPTEIPQLPGVEAEQDSSFLLVDGESAARERQGVFLLAFGPHEPQDLVEVGLEGCQVVREGLHVRGPWRGRFRPHGGVAMD